MEELTLFETAEEPETKTKNKTNKMKEGKEFPETISVTAMKYLESKNMDWIELFSGFDELHILTYSASDKGMEMVMRLFETGDIVIGSPNQVRKNVAALIANQKYEVDYVSSTPYLQQKIQENKFRIFIAKQSHEKLYLLRNNETGATRVITGSGNCSIVAWNGDQLEGTIYCDDPEYYDEKLMEYESIRDFASVEIKKDARIIEEDGSNLDELPALEEIATRPIHVEGAVIIDGVAPEEEADYIFANEKNAKKITDLIMEAHAVKLQKGVPVMTTKNFMDLRTICKKKVEEKKKKQVTNPTFILDYQNQTADFNDQPFDLHPADVDVRKDIDNVFKFIEMAEHFKGNVFELKQVYWKVIIYMFISPFIAKLRLAYAPNAAMNAVGMIFPMFLILRGGKNGGKSTIVTVGQKLMFGQSGKKISILPMAASEFKKDTFYGLCSEYFKGVPILVDEFPNTKRPVLRDIAKNERYLLDEKVDDHSCFIFTTNQLEYLPADLLKRVMLFQIDATMSDDESKNVKTPVNHLIKNMGNALYRKFLSCAFPVMNDLLAWINDLKLQETVSQADDPDIFQLSSRILIEIMKGYSYEIPPELRVFTWKDYMSESVKAERYLRQLVFKFKMTPEIFKINFENDTMVIDFTDDKMVKPDFVKGITEGLPTDVQARQLGSTISVIYSEIKKYAQFDFIDPNANKSLLRRLGEMLFK